jgi:hypothetical protein
MLDLEAGLHAESGALLDGEGVLVEIFERARLREVDDDIGAAVDFQSKGQNDDASFVVGVAQVLACPKSKRLFPFVQGFIVGI